MYVSGTRALPLLIPTIALNTLTHTNTNTNLYCVNKYIQKKCDKLKKHQ